MAAKEGRLRPAPSWGASTVQQRYAGHYRGIRSKGEMDWVVLALCISAPGVDIIASRPIRITGFPKVRHWFATPGDSTSNIAYLHRGLLESIVIM
jgi:hypothetical protein